MKTASFDYQPAQNCAQAFHISTGLGCTLSTRNGDVLYAAGAGCAHCPLQEVAGCSPETCRKAHDYGTAEANRFGGKYIYFCPLGLTFFVSPILGDSGVAARITAGPFLMVEKQDYIDCELQEKLYPGREIPHDCEAALEQIPFVPAPKATQLANLLFMSVGFLNNIAAEQNYLSTDQAYTIQSHINTHISRMKNEVPSATYSLIKEQELLRSIAHGQRDLAHQQLEELLSSLFVAGNTLPKLKARGYELIVMISRVAMENGTDPTQALDMCQHYQEKGAAIHDFSAYCSWLSGTVAEFMDSLFGYGDSKHANIIHRCIQYIGVNYAERLTLEDMAVNVYMSPAYLSRVFRQETGVTFNQYLNRVRITKAKGLLRDHSMKMGEISQAVGYEDQSYFTRVFKKITGTSPGQYRNKLLLHK